MAGVACVFLGTFSSLVSGRPEQSSWPTTKLSSCLPSPCPIVFPGLVPIHPHSSHRCLGPKVGFLCLTTWHAARIPSFALRCVVVGGRSWIYGDRATGACKIRLTAFWVKWYVDGRARPDTSLSQSKTSILRWMTWRRKYCLDGGYWVNFEWVLVGVLRRIWLLWSVLYKLALLLFSLLYTSYQI